jgi:uncharacterized membrane protein YbhN (UPF0104 family)
VLGAYLAGVGLNAITPARSGDVLKLYLVKHRIEGSTYPTLGATLVVETLFDAVVGIALLFWAVYLGVLPNIHSLPDLPNIHSLPDLPNIDLRWAFKHPVALEIGALVLGIVIGVLLVWATARVRRFWERVRQGFAVLRDGEAYLRGVVSWQALSWCFRLATLYFMLRAFHLPATIHNALLVQIAQSLSTLLPITPGGAGTEQGLLLYLFRGKAARSSLLSFSVGTHIAIVVVNVVLGLIAIVLMTRTLRLRRLRDSAKADAADAAPAADKPPSYGTHSEPSTVARRHRRRKRDSWGCERRAGFSSHRSNRGEISQRARKAEPARECPVRSPAKTMCTTCFVESVRLGAMESTMHTGPSTGTSSSMPSSSASSRYSASVRLSPASTPPPEATSTLTGFSCVEQDLPAPAEQRRDRIRGCSPVPFQTSL